MKISNLGCLTDDEKKRLDEFICLSSMQATTPPSTDIHQLALCFLSARKFSVAQALELYHNYQTMLSREGISEVIDPFDDDVRQELLSGKFVILNDHEVSGARVAQFFVRLHRMSNNNRALLQSILFQLNAAFRKEAAARCGLVFIYDMTDAKFTNIDCAFGIKLFKLLQFCYPVRLRRILILTAPLWFRASFRMMRGFIRDQLRDIVYVIRPSPGTKLDALSHPDFATVRRDHYTWLQTALTRTGWLPDESEPVSKPNGHRYQTASAFFGYTSNSISSDSVSDLSDPDSRDDEELHFGCPMDEDDLLSVVDMDPFALSSSYSSETDVTEAGSNKAHQEPVSPDGGTSSLSRLRGSRNSLGKSHSADSKSETAQKRRKDSTMIQIPPSVPPPESDEHVGDSLGDHAQTPTPPSVAKRMVLPVTAPKSSWLSDSAFVSKLPSSFEGVEFSGNLSPLALESATPNPDMVQLPAAKLRRENGGITELSRQHRDSTGAESTCSSTTSFFSTGSACVSSAPSTHSADGSPTGEPLHHRAFGTRVTSVRSDISCPLSTERNVWSDSGGEPSARRIAPLAEDEIGDQTIRHEKNPENMLGVPVNCALSRDSLSTAPTSNDLPSWAFGRPHGLSIHTGPCSNSLVSKAPDCPPIAVPLATVDAVGFAPFVDDRQKSIRSRNASQSSSISGTQNDGRSSKGSDLSSSNNGSAAGSGAEEEPEEEDELDYDLSEESADEATVCLEDYWMTPVQLAQHVDHVGLSGIHSEYSAVVRTKFDDARSAFKHTGNREKNRYCDVICYESSRVHLRPNTVQLTVPSSKECARLLPMRYSRTASLHRTLSAPLAVKDLVRNYIHANWVDGYRQKNAFICTQGPLSETVGDFWQMVWDYHVPVIVMITKVFEADRVKCFPYWPDSVSKQMYFASGHHGVVTPLLSKSDSSQPPTDASRSSRSGIPEFEVENVNCTVEDHFNCSSLRLVNMRTGEQRSVKHYAYFSWPDHGVPQTTDGLLKLLSSVQSAYSEAISHLGYETYTDQEVPPPPVVVHCSAGIGRTGTYVTADICTKWLVDSSNSRCIVNIPLTVSRVRSQRYGCVQVAAQYAFCYRVVLDFALKSGLLDADQANSALTVLTPSQPHQSSYATTSFYHSVTSLPRSHHQVPSGPRALVGGATLSEFRNMFPTSHLLSIWSSIKSANHRSVADFAETDFVMTENVCCSDSSNSDNDDSGPDSLGLPVEFDDQLESSGNLSTLPAVADDHYVTHSQAVRDQNFCEATIVKPDVELCTSESSVERVAKPESNKLPSPL